VSRAQARAGMDKELRKGRMEPVAEKVAPAGLAGATEWERISDPAA